MKTSLVVSSDILSLLASIINRIYLLAKVLLLAGVLAAVFADDDYKQPSYEKKYDGYFQYANVPGEHEYEFGYNRGNPSHYTSRYEQAKDWRFRTKVKINDLCI